MNATAVVPVCSAVWSILLEEERYRMVKAMKKSMYLVNVPVRRVHLQLAAGLGVLALALSGCASVSFDEFKEVPASRWPEREERHGLVVSVRPVVAHEEVEFFFSTNLLHYDILPVTVYLENRGEDTFAFDPENLLLTCEDGTELKPVSWRSVYDEVSFSYARSIPGFLFAILPGFMITHSVSVANERLSHNYHQKALEELNLPPGHHTQGVVFMKLHPEGPLDIEGLNGADVRLFFTRRTGQRTSPVELFFHVWGIL